MTCDTLFTLPETSYQREVVAEGLEGIFTDKSLENFTKCGQFGYLIEHQCKYQQVIVMRCKLRVCPHCSSTILHQQFKRCADLIRVMKRPRFLTLTVRNTEDIRKEYVQRLKKLFYNFRRKQRVSPHIRGGIIVSEVTHKGRGYHLHLHIIYDGDYLHWKNVQQAWQEVTGQDVVHIDIRVCRNTGHAIGYLAGYLKKGQSFASMEHFIAYHAETKGSRYFQTFGSLYRQEVYVMPSPGMICTKCGERMVLFGYDMNTWKSQLRSLDELEVEIARGVL